MKSHPYRPLFVESATESQVCLRSCGVACLCPERWQWFCDMMGIPLPAAVVERGKSPITVK